jgi:hypothetical protein
MCRRQPCPDPPYDFEHQAPQPRRSTHEPPGSDGKIRVMRRRFLRGEELFRAGDAVDWGGMIGSLVFGASWSHWGPAKLKQPPPRQAGKVLLEVADDADDES